MAVRHVQAESAVAPNLVPMVDIMFLLLLFLMLGADMGQRELEEVQLPEASKATPEPKETAPTERLTINVHHPVEKCAGYEAARTCAEREHWSIAIRGQEFQRDTDRLAAYLAVHAEEERQKHPPVKVEPGRIPPTELRVLIRADRAALYELVQTALFACGKVGIYRVEIGASVPGDS